MKNFIKASSRKMLVLALTVLMVLSVTVIASAETTLSNGTLYSPMDLFDPETLMWTSTTTQPELKGGVYDSSVWKFTALDDEGEPAILLDKTNYVKPAQAAKLDTYYKFSKIGTSSYFKFYNTTNNFNKSTLEYRQRHIEMTSVIEGLALGFTAPTEGTYEISAPISSEEGKNVKYSVIKITAEGKKYTLQAEKEYSAEDDSFCCLLTKLGKGDTVYLTATADADTVINIGLPEARLINGSTYLLTDYLEDAETSGITYPNGTVVNAASTSDTKGAWDFGYFKYSADITNKITTLTLNDFTLPAVGQGLDPNLLGIMTDYELFEDGKYYNATDITAETITTAQSGAGVMYNDNGTLYAGFHSYTAATVDATLYGHYMKYTAPVSGNAVLSFGGQIPLGNQVYLVIALNDTVKTATYSSATTANGFTFDDLKAGDEITVILMSGRYNTLNTSALRLTFGAPSVTITNTSGFASVALDANDGESAALSNDFTVIGSTVTLPSAEKAGCRFNGWMVGEELKSAGSEITVAADLEAVADYDYYGDLTGDDIVDAYDIDLVRAHLLTGTVLGERADLAELSGNDEIDILDLVKIDRLIKA